MTARWAGVDVGAARKGFHIALIDARSLVAGPTNVTSVGAAVSLLREWNPLVVAIDSPQVAALDGDLSRAAERDFVAARICGIRYTPHRLAMLSNPYYAWILNGFALYEALVVATRWTRWHVIECFPTATWSRLGGSRNGTSRACWSARILASLDLAGVPSRLSQDGRDAIAAALTARLHSQGRTESFGEIVVPL